MHATVSATLQSGFLPVRALVAAAAAALISSIAQAAVLAAAVALLLRFLPGLTAAVRSAVWTLVLLLVCCLPLLSLAWPQGTAAPAGPSQSPVHLGPVHLGPGWGLALGGLWMMAACLGLVQLGVSAVRVHRLVRRATRVEPGAALAALLRGGKRSVELCVSAEVDRPSIAGFHRARILLPPATLATLSAAELEQVVLHELEHLRRRDDWTNLLQKLALALFPLHPVLLWLDRTLCLERELACDDGVLRHTRAPKAYALCLARLAEDRMLRRGVSLVLGALGALGTTTARSQVGRRVHRILEAPQRVMDRTQARWATVVICAGVFVATGALSRSPRWISFAPESRSASPTLASAGSPTGFHLSSQRFATLAAARPAPAQVRDAAFRPQIQAARPVLVNASLPVQAHAASPRPRPDLVRAGFKGRGSVGHSSVGHCLTRTAPITDRRTDRRTDQRTAGSTSRRPAQTTARRRRADPADRTPQIFLAAWPGLPVRSRLVLTMDEFQTTYAAVPVRNGWLILQL